MTEKRQRRLCDVMKGVGDIGSGYRLGTVRGFNQQMQALVITVDRFLIHIHIQIDNNAFIYLKPKINSSQNLFLFFLDKNFL